MESEPVASGSSGLDETAEYVARLFQVDPEGEAEVLVITHKLSAGYDYLHDAGYSDAKIQEVLTDCVRGGLDPELVARKMVSFKKIIEEAIGQ